METNSFWVAAAFTFLTVVLLHSLLLRRRQPRRNLPPGPALAIPFLGHLPLLLLRNEPLHATLAGLAARHGPRVMSLRLGTRSAVVVTSMEVARQCFNEGDPALANRPRFPSVRETSMDYRALTVANYGDHYWLAGRRTATVHLHSAHRVNLMLDTVVNYELRALVRRLTGEARAATGARVDLKRLLLDLSRTVFTNDDLHGAGTETMSTTMEWAMALLLNHPAALIRAREEIDEQIGQLPPTRLPDREDLTHLQYLDGVIKETLRLCPAAPLLLPHEADTDCELDNYDVAAGTIVIVNAYAIHRDPVAWGPAPEEFRPERFLEEPAAAAGLMLPFGMGRRKCPGERLAMRTMALVLATLIQRFEWSRVGEEEIDMSASSASRTFLFKAVPLEALCRSRT